jgi:heptosyltransferase-1
VTRLSAIGDCILTMPVAAALKRHFPDCYIGWVVQGAGASLLAGHQDIDELIRVPRGWLKSPASIWHIRQQLRAGRYDYVIDPQSLTKSAMAGWLSGARRRIGFAKPQGRELAPLLNNQQISRTADHVVDAYLQLLRPLGIEQPRVEFHLPRFEPASKAIDNWLAEQQLGSRFVVMNPGAGWNSKIWPAARYGQLAAEIGRTFGLPTVVVWAGGRELDWSNEIVSLSDQHAQTACSTSLPELTALLRRASLFVGSDTGPLHLAAAVGTTCVSMYGPTRPADCGPYGSQHMALQAYYQHGNARQRRSASNDAMCAIPVKQVFEAVRDVLARSSQAAA